MQAIIRCPKCKSVNVEDIGSTDKPWTAKPLRCNDCLHRFSMLGHIQEEAEG